MIWTILSVLGVIFIAVLIAAFAYSSGYDDGNVSGKFEGVSMKMESIFLHPDVVEQLLINSDSEIEKIRLSREKIAEYVKRQNIKTSAQSKAEDALSFFETILSWADKNFAPDSQLKQDS